MLVALETLAVHFDTYDVAIKDVFVSADVNENLDAIVRVQVATSESPESSVAVELLLNGQTVDIKKTQAGHSTVEFHLKRPELWWPHRYGPAPLYTVRVKALAADGKRELDSRTTQFGIRRAKLVQRPLADQPGKTFFFEINNVPIFCVGSNWIPGHSFTSLLTEADYLSWIEMAVNGNQDMLRIWAGGYYEDDALLAECVSRVGVSWPRAIRLQATDRFAEQCWRNSFRRTDKVSSYGTTSCLAVVNTRVTMQSKPA